MAFPAVATSASSNVAAGSASKTVTLPTGIASGDVLVLWFHTDGNTTISWPAGYTELFEADMATEGGSGTGSLAHRTCDGTEGSSITVTTGGTQEAAWGVYRITGASGNVEHAFAEGSSATPDPPNLTPSWGAKDTLWIATACEDNADLTGTAPTNYANNVLHQFNTDAEIVMGTRALNAASENPGTFAAAADEWICATVAVEPAGGGAFSVAANGGTYTVTGATASLEVGKLVSAAGGSYAISGTAASLEHSYPLVATGGSYVISGSAATLLHSSLVAANGGVYTISGSAATLSKTIPIVAGSGSYSISGTDANLEYGRLVVAGSGSYELAGSVANLEFGRLLSATGGSYSISGADVTFVKGFGVAASGGSYAIGGGAASLLVSKLLAASGGSYVVTGAAATLTYDTGGAPPVTGIIEPPLRRRRR